MSGEALYPEGSVRAVLGTNLVTEPTAAALKRRLQPAQAPSGALEAEEFSLLSAICERLFPQNDRAQPIDIAGHLISKMVAGPGDGWRYATLPPDREALAVGLVGIDETSWALFGDRFVDLGKRECDAVLRDVQNGTAPGVTWIEFDGSRWFEELLVAATEIYFSHPIAQEEIGYLGMADAQGWPNVGLGARAPHEPVEQT